ncbi:MAG: T9SS type A sorting domain-containing protein [Candidatus Cloacimonetes bacterium]|nr:T9SS type A sorting domain-containing protein [Candidatus Cloacimonadota bacterium]
MVGIDPQLIDPEHGDYRVAAGSPAEGYGCQIFPPDLRYKSDDLPEPTLIHHNNNPSRSSIEVSGSITINTIWDVDTVKVVGNVLIENGVTVSITPGTKIEFQDYYALFVQGQLLAIGEPENFVHFTSAQPELFSFDHSSLGSWNGIKFINTSSLNGTSKLECCHIEYAKEIEENGVGGAIYSYNFSDLEITNCIFQNNFADYGAVLGLEYRSAPIITDNLMFDNYAFLGGSPIYCTYSYPRLLNNTMVNNTVLNEDLFFNTGTIHTFLSKPQIINNIVWDNLNYYLGGTQLLECKGFYTIYNNIEAGHEGEGNIDSDPLFFNAAGNEFMLRSNSPCINTGTLDVPFGTELPDFDLAGNPRIYDSSIDMGCYEWQGTPISNEELPITNYELKSYPNPFNPETKISFTAEHAENAKIEIFNIKGQKIKTLIDKSISAGNHTVVWNGTDANDNKVSSGVYLYKVEAGDYKKVKKMVLLK